MNTRVYTVHIMNKKQKENAATLSILEAIENKEDVTQRHIANRLDVALGLANLYLKRCANKGLIKITQAPANRYLYYLTPKGFSEKSRLTGEYLTSSFNFYRNAGDSLNEVFEICKKNNWERILLCGKSELAEIASIRASEKKITIVGTVDKKSKQSFFLGFPMWESIDDADEFDACIITSLEEPFEIYTETTNNYQSEKILVPSILGIKKS